MWRRRARARDRIEQLEARVRSLELDAELHDMAAAGLRDRLDRLDAYLQPAPADQPVEFGSGVHDITDFNPDLEVLGRFVDELVSDMGLRQQLLHCWYRHPSAVLLLEALREQQDVRESNYGRWVWDMEVNKAELRTVFRRCRAGHVEEVNSWHDEAYREAYARHSAALRAAGREQLAATIDSISPFVEHLVLLFGLQHDVLHCWIKHAQVISTLRALRSTMRMHNLQGCVHTVRESRLDLRLAFRRCRAGHMDDLAGWRESTYREDFAGYVRGLPAAQEED
ncbi:hypothetical protein ACFQZ4_19980 [Catellatospora coxensis]|uniref:Uncharacterized protein n=1 Tax=Catellatospora coxensis TaxID=310354 RepID=A0A8J3KQQ1_9ACTN|nr:hypothetical protein [Catellatospora coxensis]GIG04498.1 hypothetical protein Cco03nite_11980 [Catellatospora coxensis]